MTDFNPFTHRYEDTFKLSTSQFCVTYTVYVYLWWVEREGILETIRNCEELPRKSLIYSKTHIFLFHYYSSSSVETCSELKFPFSYRY